MGFWSTLLGSGVKEAGEGISAALDGVGGLAQDIRSAITGDLSPEKKAELTIKLQELEQTAMIGQVEINKIEAGSSSLFVAGWRPFIGWVGGIALAYHFILNRLIEWLFKLWKPDLMPPAFDLGDLISIIIAMLGLGAFRTIEKSRTVQGNH